VSFYDTISSSLEDTGIDPANLTIEITESTLLSAKPETIDLMSRLKRIGIKLAIDDFGTGYSSLVYLKRFPLDYLKIDREFIQDVATDAKNGALARSIISMGMALGLEVVAEGVEREEQVSFLRREKCRLAQGFHLGVPRPADHFEAWLQESCQ
jgi:EAL domain-containing protein (putative c-di-GMP-specific phosphodiesterase class I)